VSDVALERLRLPAGIGLRFVDAFGGAAIGVGVRCTLLDSASGRIFARSAATPSGVHHFPSLRADRLSSLGSVEVLIEDESGDFLPLRVAWPPPVTVTSSGARIAQVELSSAPSRRPPVGAASVFASLCNEFDEPAAWARITLESSNGRLTTATSDADGQLAIHLPFPRPERTPPDPRSPLRPPPDPLPRAVLRFAVFYGPDVAVEARATAARLPGRVQAPRRAAWLGAPAAVARADEQTALAAVVLNLGQASVLRTAGRSELVLSPV
jgi:hypothetical protein